MVNFSIKKIFILVGFIFAAAQANPLDKDGCIFCHAPQEEIVKETNSFFIIKKIRQQHKSDSSSITDFFIVPKEHSACPNRSTEEGQQLLNELLKATSDLCDEAQKNGAQGNCNVRINMRKVHHFHIQVYTRETWTIQK